MYTVTLKGGSPWGFRFQGGCDFNEPIKIAKINPNSKAYKEGIKVGDYIEHINGQKTEGLLHNDVQQIIKCANKELTLDLRSCKSPMMNGQINGDIHPIEAQIISGIFRATPHYIQPQRKTTADDYKPISYHTISTTTNSSSSRPPSSVKVNPSPYRGSHSVPSSPRFQSKLIVPITSPKPLRHRDAAWDRSSPSPSLWSTTSCYTSDSARSTPQTSPACRRRQPPLPLPKPITTGGRSRRQIFEHSSSLGSSARSLVSPNRSLGSPSRSISPATSDHSSKGMQMFLRQMEKLSRYSDDEDKGVSDSSTLTAHSLPQEDRQLPIMKEEVAVEEHIIPISVKRERMIPLTIKTSTPDLRNFPQEETRSLDSGITSRGSSWQSGSFKDGNFSPGSYYTLPVRKSSSEKVTDKQNDDFDYSKCTTLPTIKPLKTHRGYESEMNYDGRGINDVRVQSQRKPIVVPQDGYNTDVDYSGRGRGDMRVRSQRKPIIVPQDGYNTDVDYSGRGRGDMHIHSQRKPIVLQDGYNTDLDYNGRGRGDMRVHSHRKPIGVPQDGYSTDVDFCVRNNHRNNQDYSQGRQFNQRDFIHDMDLDSIKLPQKAKLYDQRGFVSEVDLSSLDSQPDFNRFRQWPAQPQTQPQAQPQYNPPQPVDSNLPRRHSETVQSPKYVTPSRQEKPNYTKWTPKSSPSVVRRQGSLDSSSSSPNRGRYIPIKVMHEESPQQPDVDTRVGQKNEEERPNHEVPPAMNGTHISTEYSPTTNIESHHEPTSPRRTVVHTESKPVISNVAPVWNPKKGTLFQKKEYKPIKLDTLRKTSMEIQKQHVENQKPEELNIIPPPPEDSYACQQPEKDELHEYKSFVSYNPQTSISETAPAEPSRTEYAPYQPKTEFVDYTFSNGQFDDEPSRLPPTQSPFVTLLRKGRENGFPVDLKDIKNVTEPLVIDTEGQIPKGALYIGEQALVQDGLKHTDTYYAVPTTEEEDMSQQSPTSPSEKKPLKYDGIGPTDDGGMPLSFRMNVDEKNQHQWYKQMYKSLHTSKKKEESNSYRPTYEFPEVKTEPKPKEDTKKPVVEETVTKENPYKPAYELPSTHREDSSKFRVSEKNKQNGRLSSSQTEKITKTDFNQRKELFTGKKDVDAGYRSEPENSSTTKSRSKSLSDFKADFKSSTKPKTFEWNPPNARSTVEKYRCQPRSIVDYEPGFSSLAFQEAKTGPGRYRSYSENSPTERKKKTDSTKGAVHNPPIDKPGQFSRYTEGAHTRLAAGAGDNNSDEAANQADLYKLVQQGGDIPIRGLQKPGPDKSGTFKFQTSDVRRSPTERVQRRREDEEEYRRKRLEQIYEEERRRKIEQEKADLEARKHNDFFTAAQKSPIPADRFEEPISGYNTVPADRRRGFKIHGKAKAVYNFNAQNPRELSFRKGDIIYLLRQIDKNWFEGERYGRSGLFPVNYVEVLTSIEEAHTAAQQAEGQARVRYNFTAQTGVELTLRKGDIVTLLRSVDENWYEGRVGNKQGIFPRSYIEVIFDPSTPLVTPAPSVITTPMTGTPEMLSPSGYDAPTPPPQPSPRAFSPRSSAFQHHQQRQFSPQQQGMSPHQQTLSPQQQGMSPHQQSFSPQQQGLSPHQQTFSASQQGLNSHQPAFSPQRSSYTSPRYDGPQQQRMEDGPVRVNGYSQYNGDYNGSPQHQGQQQGRPRQSPTIGRKQFVSNGPSYPPSANINYNVETNNNEIRNKVPDDDLALCRYRAVFAYRPQNDDELELLEGDEVYVMEKCDDGWYVGTSNRTAMFGTFPGNYVQLIQ
ncbi:sorbin and SH3 domain-containing protein 1 homolog isoform X40 [Mytilus edulis]|uniref:sorbin and SH3 domain-containing protein 1 homolog isoform X40 n=1 Tax=Mytilus edulis TaxID=6550 RepID=UPI0039EE4ED8